jgi:GT2 family glycosyltransferase
MRELTEQCVDSIVRHTKFPYRIIAVDNASDEETRLYLESLTKRKDVDVRVIRNEENLGNSKAANQGIRASDAEYVCILDNDTLVMDNWLTEMVSVAERDEKIGVVNPLSNYGAKKPLGKSWEDVGRKVYEENRGNYIETAAAIGFCFLIKRKVIEKIGVWSEAYGPGYFEDTEYSIRAIKNGYKVVIARGAYVVHLEHSSFKKKGGFSELFSKNQKLFYDEFGKSKRLLYILTGKKIFDLDKNAYENAQARNWIWIFSPGKVNMDLPEHAYIKFFRLNGLLFQLNCILRVLGRKKRFDVIYSDSTSLGRKLRLLKGLHKAEVRV